MISAIIMASGKSERMGENKLLLPYKGKPMIEHVIDVVVSCHFHEVIIVVSDTQVLDIAKRKKIHVVFNDFSEKGQSESIKLGLENTTNSLGYAFFTGDQPCMDTGTIQELMQAFYQDKEKIIVPYFEDIKGTPVIFPSHYKNEFMLLKGDTGGKPIISAHKDQVKMVMISNPYFLWDIDTKADYKRLKRDESNER